MKKILIGGAGGAPSEGVIYSLLKSPEKEAIIGMGSVKADLYMSKAPKKYIVPFANEADYKRKLLKIIGEEKPDLLHVQNDLEVYYASLYRDEITDAGTAVFMPDHKVIETCVSKWKTWLAFKKAGIIVPHNVYINDENDLARAFDECGDINGKIWLRAEAIGGGGIGSIPTNDYQMAKSWINRNNGWGKYIAAEMLSDDTITFLSIWWRGELIVAQTRKRAGWIHGNRTVSGVTGVTKIGITCTDDTVTTIAINAIKAADSCPHGIFGVDMAYDNKGVPNPTEINISRFFTTIRFFTEAGLNMPVIYKNLALYEKKPTLEKVINPLPNGLVWLRAMDKEPILTTKEEMDSKIISL